MKHLLLAAGMALALTAAAQTDTVCNTIQILPTDTHAAIIGKAVRVVPTPNQLAAMQDEFIAFVHFGPNTFTRREWGNGKEDPKVFALRALDTDQWCAAIKAAGMKKVIFTAKHHDGFVLWQSRYTRHGIISTGFRDGQGDVLRDLAASCRKYGLKLGIYLSPADLYQIEHPDGLYGNLSAYTRRTVPREVPGRPFVDKRRFSFVVDDYNEYFLNQLFELLTEYGPVDEVWFDGAHPKRKGGQRYNYAAWRELIRTLAPQAVIFGREDVRWCGNEAGGTRQTEWNVVPYAADPDTMTVFADMTATDLGSREQLYKAAYLHYQPAETNTSIREGGSTATMTGNRCGVPTTCSTSMNGPSGVTPSSCSTYRPTARGASHRPTWPPSKRRGAASATPMAATCSVAPMRRGRCSTPTSLRLSALTRCGQSSSSH